MVLYNHIMHHVTRALAWYDVHTCRVTDHEDRRETEGWLGYPSMILYLACLDTRESILVAGRNI